MQNMEWRCKLRVEEEVRWKSEGGSCWKLSVCTQRPARAGMPGASTTSTCHHMQETVKPASPVNAMILVYLFVSSSNSSFSLLSSVVATFSTSANLASAAARSSFTFFFSVAFALSLGPLLIIQKTTPNNAQ